ncbi:NAD(P)/FAD-dependent oxidoreductase [Thermoplasma sp.]|uniref:NAD(P)/FAD-dependent oxidoreductase n=1 Tax=Thermoplasma sp. TaxID=1973142 RepID=UPI00128817BE|nr:NAD(P)/FAD-dependent oxidoreductase [Thermoplasma sp.]KAA8923055.1 MAG: NAD(P)/FAD-dependent oxidoreductase [Thermoplasma sp.]
MRISIKGLGISGLYLYERLRQGGFNVSGFDIKRPDFYIPCAYATNLYLMKPFMSKIGVDFEEYVFHHAESIILAGERGMSVEFRSAGLVTFDRNRLQMDLMGGIAMKNDQDADIVVDATGISRYYLGRDPGDITYYTKEYLTDRSSHDDFYFLFLERGNGYLWEFPLDKGHFHVGVGSRVYDDLHRIDQQERIKITGRKIRMKPLFESARRGNIVGIGEAVGTVSPLTGEGILPSIESAELLYDLISHGSDPDEVIRSYTKKLRDRFSSYYQLSEFVERVQAGNLLRPSNLRYAGPISREMKHFGIDFSLVKAVRSLI